CASAARISVNPSPPSARPPILRNSRREIPSQKRCRSPLMVSTQAPPWLQRQSSVVSKSDERLVFVGNRAGRRVSTVIRAAAHVFLNASLRAGRSRVGMGPEDGECHYRREASWRAEGETVAMTDREKYLFDVQGYLV